MKGSKKDLIRYRLNRARDTFDDARILADKEKWNSTINRLYYSAYYAVIALLLDSDLKPTTHNGTKSYFSEYFIKKGQVSLHLNLAHKTCASGVGIYLEYSLLFYSFFTILFVASLFYFIIS